MTAERNICHHSFGLCMDGKYDLNLLIYTRQVQNGWERVMKS